MKPAGKWILGIDFDGKEGPRVYAVPMRGAIPQWHKAETLTPDAMERLVKETRDRVPCHPKGTTFCDRCGLGSTIE